MKKGLTELVFILDRSGSMSGLEADTIGGFNSMLHKQQKQEGEAYVTTVLFDDKLSTLHDRLDIREVKDIGEKDYQPGGCTALLDAMGCTIEHIADIHKYARPEDMPEHTIFVITTDGMENASRRYTKEQLKKAVEAQKEKGWEFIFFGANMDAIAVADGFGIAADRAVTYKNDSRGNRLKFSVGAEAVSALRSNAPLACDWKAELEKDMKRK